MKLTIKIDVPYGYEIDKDKSTFENIVFKKVDDVVIEKHLLGVRIKYGNDDFILQDIPNIKTTATNAKLMGFNLPTINQLKLINTFYNEINNLLKNKLNKFVYYSNDRKDGSYCSFNFRKNMILRSRDNVEYYIRGIYNL